MNEKIDETIGEKINFISNNIDFISETDDIISFINMRNINYSHNSNGYFVNLSLLRDEDIDGIYKLVSIKIKGTSYENKCEITFKEKGRKKISINTKPLKLDSSLENVLKFNFA
jgi:hypothetical protein